VSAVSIDTPSLLLEGSGGSLTTRGYSAGGIEAEQPSPDSAGELDLESIYRKHAPELSRFLARLTGQSESPDVLHEVFLVAQRQLSAFRGDSSVRTWLYAIAVRVVAARRRKQRLRRMLWLESGNEAEEALDEATPEQVLEKRGATRTVYAVLERLSERDRTLILLFELEGLPAREIARVVGSSENAVWVGLHRARARFRKLFVELFPEPGGPA
jgi:RNA polymerase sigma-70 factor, ECF subfamily